MLTWSIVVVTLLEGNIPRSDNFTGFWIPYLEDMAMVVLIANKLANFGIR
jgi:hypothetical protein